MVSIAVASASVYAPLGSLGVWEYWSVVFGVLLLFVGGLFAFLKFMLPFFVTFDRPRLFIDLVDDDLSLTPSIIRLRPGQNVEGVQVRAHFFHISVSNRRWFSGKARRAILYITKVQASFNATSSDWQTITLRDLPCAWVPRETADRFVELEPDESRLADGFVFYEEGRIAPWLQQYPYDLQEFFRTSSPNRVRFHFQARSGAARSNSLVLELRADAAWREGRTEAKDALGIKDVSTKL